MISITIEHRRNKTQWWVTIGHRLQERNSYHTIEVHCLDYEHAMEFVNEIVRKELSK